MTITETQAVDTPALRMPTVSHVAPINTGRATLIDCPEYAWTESDQAAIHDLRERFGFQWVSDWRDDLDTAARDLIRDHLLIEWRKRGYEPEFMDDTARYEDLARNPAPTDPSDQTYWDVWKAASAAITAEQLIAKANLTAYAR